MLDWYYKEVVKKAGAVWRSLCRIVIEEFSMPLLLRTLFAPWRKDITPLSGTLQQIFQSLVENLVSRGIGFVVRFLTLVVGLIFLIFAFIFGGLGFLLVCLFPLTVIGTVIVFFLHQNHLAHYPPLFAPLNQILSSTTEANTNKQLLPYLELDVRSAYQQSQTINEFLSRLTKNRRFLFVLTHLGLSPSTFLRFINPQTPPSRLLLETAKVAQSERIKAPDFLWGLFRTDEVTRMLLKKMKLSEEDLFNLIDWERRYFETLHQPSRLFFPERIRTTGGVGRLWSAGYTPNLDRFSHDIEVNISGENPLHFEAHKEVIDQIEIVLARSGKHNVILVAEPGVGKRTVALGFASRVLYGLIPPSLAHRRVVELNIDVALAGAGSLGETEERLVLALNEAVRAGNIILFVDNIDHLFEQREAKPGALDLSALLLPYLQRSDFQLIGTTTYDGYHRWIETNPNLANVFEKVEIKEPTPQQTLKIIEETALHFEARYKILILYQALKEVVTLSDRYLGDRRFPEKAIDLLDEVCAFVVENKKKSLLTEEDVAELITQKTHVPVKEAEVEEKEKLLNLETRLHQRLVNQEEAVKEIAESLRRARTGLTPENRPIGSFLFLGPTGVGKTECAKSLADVYFGDENQMIRFDMSEYQEISSVSRLIGGPAGPGLLVSRVREKPFSLLLLDEIEKAHPNILNLFLQVLDEGHLTDATGRRTDFKNTIIIATSNAGSEWIREQIKTNKKVDKEAFLDYLLKTGLFKPEFLNRFDGVIAFRPLTQEELEQVVEIMIQRLAKQLEAKQIQIGLSEGAKKKLAQVGFDPVFGARALRRVIQEKVENQIAKAILENRLSAGSTFFIDEEMI